MATADPMDPGDPAWLARLIEPRSDPAPDGDPPDDATMAVILHAATTVPDHGGLRPWRFAVVAGGGRDRFASALVAGLHEMRGTDVPEAAVEKMRNKAYAAPCAVMLIASTDPTSNVAVWEQEASASCTGYAIVLAATSLGLGAVWKSAHVLGTGPVRALFSVSEGERLLGWVNLGSARPPGGRVRPIPKIPLADLVTVVDSESRRFGE